MFHTVSRFTAVILLSVLLGAAASLADAGSNARAEAIAARTLEAMGGQEGLAATRYIRFNFFGFRLHHWDQHTGRHRLEGKGRDGDTYVIIHNLNTREGQAWVNGEPQMADELKKRLEYAYGAWINDTYWLLMPYKLRDSGVHLSHDGEEEIDGKKYDKLKLTFDGVGLTPGDTYWAYINQETHLMDRWSYFLQDWEADKEPTVWEWTDWRDYGRIKLSGTRKNLGDGSERPLGEIAVFDELPDSVFTSP